MTSNSELPSTSREPKHVRMFVNRIEEHQKFENLVKTPADERDEFILAFYGPPGIGKSLLLRKLEYECSKSDIATAFIILDREGSDMNNPIEVMRFLAKNLGKEEFAEWFNTENAWFSRSELNSQPQQSDINLKADHIDIGGDVVGGSKYVNSQVYYAATSQAALNPQGAQWALTEKFLEILRKFVEKKAVVIIFDGFDSDVLTSSVRTWLLDNLLNLPNDFGRYGILSIISLLNRPDFSYDPTLQEKIKQFHLKPLTREHIIEFFTRRKIPEEKIVEQIEGCLSETEGIPSRIYNFYIEKLSNI